MDYYVLLQAGTNSDKFEYINKIQLTRRKYEFLSIGIWKEMQMNIQLSVLIQKIMN